ncbi:MAG: hypothetical protein JNM18_18415 [Planctomycetaceae bacterium]|nr:hypothetical protein [Planctomycetaceae bacterium]
MCDINDGRETRFDDVRDILHRHLMAMEHVLFRALQGHYLRDRSSLVEQQLRDGIVSGDTIPNLTHEGIHSARKLPNS